jgi:hypothetical protein
MPLLTQEIFTAFQERLGRPPVFVNGYAFALSTGPTRPGPEMEGRNAFDVWDQEFQPQIHQGTAAMRTADYASLTTPELASKLPALIDEASELHYLTMTTLQGFLAPGVVDRFLQTELGDEGATLAMTLLQGEANQTTGADAVLGHLAQEASRSRRSPRCPRRQPCAIESADGAEFMLAGSSSTPTAGGPRAGARPISRPGRSAPSRRCVSSRVI